MLEGLGAGTEKPHGLCGWARTKGLTALAETDPNAPEVVALLRALNLDVLVCVGLDRLLSRAFRETCALCLNAHPSQLPHYRGPSPLFWQRRDGLSESAVTLHEMTRGADAGPIVASRAWSMRPRATGDVLFADAGRLAGRLLVRALVQARAGQLMASAQPAGMYRPAPRPTAIDAFIDPSAWRCAELANFVCAAAYFCPAWLRIKGVPTSFRGTSAVSEPPGSRLSRLFARGMYEVRCQDGALFLQQ